MQDQESEILYTLRKIQDSLLNSFHENGFLRVSYLLVNKSLQVISFGLESENIEEWDVSFSQKIKEENSLGILCFFPLTKKLKSVGLFVLETPHNRIEEYYSFSEGLSILVTPWEPTSSFGAPFYFERTREDLC